MDLNKLSTVIGVIIGIGTIVFAVYKTLPKLKVEIKPVADNFFFGTIGDTTKHQKWTHRMVLRIFNHGFSARTIIEGELEISLGTNVYYIDMLGSEFNKVIDRNHNYQNKFIVSDLKLPTGANLRIVVRDSKGKTYKSNSLPLDAFDPNINPIA